MSPLAAASSTGRLAGSLEQRLAEEVSQPVGSYLALPKADATDPEANTDSDAALRGDIRQAAGRQVFVESMADAWGTGAGAAPRRDWSPARFGADPPQALEALRTSVGRDVLNACAIPVGLIESADGTAAREGARRFVMMSCSGMAALMATEFAAKIAPIEIDFAALYARDLVGRSQAFSRLVGEGKLTVNDARAVCGL